MKQSYLVTQKRELIVEAESAADARKIAETVFYMRPGFSKELRRSMRTDDIRCEKRNG